MQRVHRRDEHLADQRRVEPRGREPLDVTAIADPRLRDTHDAVGHDGGHPGRPVRVDGEAVQVALVHTDHGRTGVECPAELALVVDLDERGHIERDDETVQARELAVLERRDDQQDGVCSHRPSIENVALAHGEVLAQHGELDGGARGLEVGTAAGEERLVGEHGQTARPACSVRSRQGCRVELGREHTLRRRAALDLGDQCDVADAAQRHSELPRRRGGPCGLLERVVRSSVRGRPSAVVRNDLVEVRPHRGHPTGRADAGQISRPTRAERSQACDAVQMVDSTTRPSAQESTNGTIVVVEDDHNIAELLDLYLRNAGFRVLQAGDARRGLELVSQERPVLVVFDIGLPGPLDGLQACRELRKTSEVPIVIVTARDDELDRVLGLELGADDYVTKPFSPRELVARVRAILRRSENGRRASDEPIAVGSVVVDTLRRDVKAGGVEVQLTAREFDLLAFFAENPGIVLSRQQLLDGVWGSGWYGDERTVDVHVRQLRRKLGDALPLATVWGVGYRCG